MKDEEVISGRAPRGVRSSVSGCEQPLGPGGVTRASGVDLEAAVAAIPDIEIKANQKYLPMSPEAREDLNLATREVLDRNGNPTGKEMFSTSVPIRYTLQELGQMKALLRREISRDSERRIKALESKLAAAQADVRRLRDENEKLIQEARNYDREGRESRVQARIKEAVDARGIALEQANQQLRAELHEAKSQVSKLAEDKKRLRAALNSR